MNRRGAGVAFLAIGAFLFAVRYVTDAMLLPPNRGMGSYDFRMAHNESGVFLLLLSILFFILGMVYFILGISRPRFSVIRKKQKRTGRNAKKRTGYGRRA